MEENQDRLIETKPVETRFERIAVDEIEYPNGTLKPHAGLVDSISMLGVLDPIRVEQVRRGSYRIKDGLRRVGAVRLLRTEEQAAEVEEPRWESIPAIIEEPDAMIGDATRIVGHATRRDNPIVELEVIEHYIAQGYSESEITRVTKLPVGTIRKRMKLQGLPEPMREEVRAGKVSSAVGEQMATLPPDIQETLQDKYREEGKLTAKDVRETRSVYHEENVGLTFEGLEPPEEEEPYKTPEHPHEYASTLGDFLLSMGFAVDVRVPEARGDKEATVYLTHEDGAEVRLRVIPKGVGR